MNPSDFYRTLIASITDADTKRVAEYMAGHVGEKNAVALEGLCRDVFGEYNDSTDRKTRKILETLVTVHHLPVGAYSGKSGRWLCADDSEVEKVAADLESRIQSTTDRIRNLRMAKTPPQMPNFERPRQPHLDRWQ